MPARQTTFAARIPEGTVGRRANMEEWNTFTGIAEDVTANPIGFGVPVMWGSAGERVKKLATTGIFRGITEADVTLSSESFPEGSNVPVCEEGVMWVKAAAAVTRGAAVYWHPTNGYFPASATGRIPLPGVFWDSAAGANALAKIRIRAVPGVVTAA